MKLLTLNLVAVNDKLNICQLGTNGTIKARNSFLNFWIPYALKALGHPISCPIKAGTYRWKQQILELDYNRLKIKSAVVLSKVTYCNFTLNFFMMNGTKKIQLLRTVEISKFTWN
jgi:hypothetical protein